MTEEQPAPVSAELLWNLIERKAEEDPTFRHHLLAYVVLQTQSTAFAGRLFDLLGLPRDKKPAPGINPLSMCFDVGVGAFEDISPEELASVFKFIKDSLGVPLSANTPSTTGTPKRPKPPPDPDPNT